jgi:class 3 adenylate cyclase
LIKIGPVDNHGFTTQAAMMHPDRIVRLLDLIIPEMLNIIIERHKGMVDKLLGDGIMAVYGHPYQTGEEIIQAIYSATHAFAARMLCPLSKTTDFCTQLLLCGINIIRPTRTICCIDLA